MTSDGVYAFVLRRDTTWGRTGAAALINRPYAPVFFRLSYRPQHVLEGAKNMSQPSTPHLVHHNSTASLTSVSGLPDEIPLSSRSAPSIDLTDSAHLQLVLDPELCPKSPLRPQLLHQYSPPPWIHGF